ncbi:MAG: AMP-binding protein [Agarilytica sp.]
MVLTPDTLFLTQQIEKANGSTIAAIDSLGNSITYGMLRETSAQLAEKLGPNPRLVLLEAENSVNWLVAYVACLSGGHPIVFTPAKDESTFKKLCTDYQVDVALRPNNNFEPEFYPDAPKKNFHPELAVLLSTSGSTGSSKCVKLSHSNLAENSKSISEYLRIDANEKGVANLPTHYSYGLSIINSHLYSGATILLTSLSVIEDEFWEFLNTNKATSFAGVPHVFDLLTRTDFEKKPPQSLRYVTQAGGRLEPKKVQHFLDIAKRNDWDFFVMYGQTEATARMAYMPPGQLENNISSIGLAIPNGTLTVIGDNGRTCDTGETGELVYQGPNVMMGYSTSFTDLNDAPISQSLTTGDIGHVDKNGFYYITGRRSRFIKVFGNRIGLDDVEQLCSNNNIDTVATGVDDHLLIATTEEDKTENIETLIQEEIKIPRGYFSVLTVDEFPYTPAGKVDYPKLKSFITETNKKTKASFSIRSLFEFGHKRKSDQSIADVYLETFGESALDKKNTFRTLGGDSLTYVRVASILEARIEQPPKNWDTLTLVELTKLEKSHPSSKSCSNTGLHSNFDTLRSLACLLVVFCHVIGQPHTGLKIDDGPLRWLADSLDYFRMPIFMAMAGFFYATLTINKGNASAFFKKHLKMLMIPAIFITLVYWAVRRIGYGLDEPLLPYLFSGYLHLWFIYALMVTLTVAALIDVFLKSNTWLWVILIILTPIAAHHVPHMPLFSISQAIEYFCFFSIGVLINRNAGILKIRALFAISSVLAAAAIGAQQLSFFGFDNPIVQWPYWWHVGGSACLMLMIYLFPRMPSLEVLSIFTYSIYLWHPFANGVIRFALQQLHVESLTTLIIIGFTAGVLGPIILHRTLIRFPAHVRTLFIGR